MGSSNHYRVLVRAVVGFFILVIVLPHGVALGQSAAPAEAIAAKDSWGYGLKIRAGGRYDNVRMCVASAAGFPGGPALEISAFMEFGLSEDVALSVELPLFRPVFFGAAFSMLQFDPEVGLLFRRSTTAGRSWIFGPTLGLSFHYGPDYNSESSGEGRGPSFFAMGPRIGGYLGLNFERLGKSFEFQIGVHPYVTPLFSIDDPASHSGVVIGGTLDALFRFGTR